MLLFIASIVGAVLFFGIGGVKADEVSGKWVVEFIIEDMSDDMDYYDFSDYIGETTEGTLIVDLDEDGNGTAKLVTTVDGTDYDYEVMEAQYDKGKLVCIADTKSESIEFTGNVRRKGDIYKLWQFKMSFIEDVKTLSSGKWTATKDVNQTANSKQANSSSKKEKAVNEQSQKRKSQILLSMQPCWIFWENGKEQLFSVLSLVMKKIVLGYWKIMHPRMLLNSLTT